MEQVQVPPLGAITTYSAKSALFTAGLADRGTFFDNTGSYTISFAAAATLGAGWSCWIRNVSGTQTLDPNGAELINGAATYAVSNAGDVVLVECTGTAFVISHSQRPATVAITGGTIEGTPIGAVTPAAGAFTTLSSSGLSTLNSASITTTLGVTGVATLTAAAVFTGGFAASAASTFTVAGSTILTLTNTNASASNAGGGMRCVSNDGAAMASGDRLGHFTFAGAKDGVGSLANSCRFEALATEAWTATATGTKLALYTCANGTTTATIALTLEQDLTATFASTIIAPTGTTAIPSIRIPHGSAPSSPTNGDMWTTTSGLFIRINGATVGPLS